jgi:hypothetical protein
MFFKFQAVSDHAASPPHRRFAAGPYGIYTLGTRLLMLQVIS